MFFEAHHSTERNYFQITISERGSSFPLHIHRAFECYAVRSGSATAIINGKEYMLSPGDAVLVFPYQRHEYKTESGTSTWVCIFSPDLVGSFNNGASVIPECNKFSLTPYESIPDSILLKKAICYNICGIFDMNAKYIENPGGEEYLITKILIYISKNYTSSCTLKEVANYVGYDYSYISKFFKKMMGINFKTYIRGLQIDEACRLLLTSEYSVHEIAEICGFSCTRTFNREFLEKMKMTPREFGKKKKSPSCNQRP